MGACGNVTNKHQHQHQHQRQPSNINNNNNNNKVKLSEPSSPKIETAPPKSQVTHSQSTYLNCPLCSSNNISIKQITFKQEDNYVSYTCNCSPSQLQEQTLSNMLNSNPSSETTICNTHNQQFLYYCIQCDKYICEKCNESEHQKHSVVSYDDLKTKIDSNKLVNQEILGNIDVENKKREELYKETKEKLLDKYDTLIKNIEMLKNNSLSSLDKQNDKCKQELNYLQTLYKQAIESSYEKNGKSFGILKQLEFITETNLLKKSSITANINSDIDTYINNINPNNISVQFGYQFKVEGTANEMNKTSKLQTMFTQSDNNISYIEEKENKYPSLNNILSTDTNTPHIEYVSSIKGHNDKVITMIMLSSGNLASGGYDKSIRIWNISTYTNEQILNEDGCVLTLLEFKPNNLLSGTNSNTINLWLLDSYRKIFTFNGHILWVNSLVKLTEELFASCSNDSIINIWNYNTHQKEKTLEEHNDCVLTMIHLNNGYLCSGSADNSIRIWDWMEERCVHTLEEHTQWVKCLCELDNGDILSGSDDKTIKVWRDAKCVITLEGHESPVRALFKVNANYFLSGSFDNSIRVWEIDANGNMECRQIEQKHKDNVISIIKGNGRSLYSCSNDKSIIEWKWNK